jgi:hypothetical protein
VPLEVLRAKGLLFVSGSEESEDGRVSEVQMKVLT